MHYGKRSMSILAMCGIAALCMAADGANGTALSSGEEVTPEIIAERELQLRLLTAQYQEQIEQYHAETNIMRAAIGVDEVELSDAIKAIEPEAETEE